MMKMGAYYMDPMRMSEIRFQFFRKFFAFALLDEIENAKKGLPLPAYEWLPDIQVVIARDMANDTTGFFVAAKGGHNDESHNHNDLGNYVVFYNGAPVLIDVGSGTYTSKTFSSRRYEIWYNRSDYHNVPTINGITQAPGREFEALEVFSKNSGSGVHFGLDLRKAYPSDARIERWARSINYKRRRQVILDNDFALRQEGNIIENMMTNWKPDLSTPGKIVLPAVDESGTAIPVAIYYNSRFFAAEAEKITMAEPEDEGVLRKWGDHIYRIKLIGKQVQRTGKYRVVIERDK